MPESARQANNDTVLNLRRPIRKLEAERYDCTGRVPHSESWYAFYIEQLDRIIDGDETAKCPPLSFIDEMLARADREGATLE